MAHKVLCLYCHKEFDRDKFPFVQVGSRRYAHPECAEANEKQLSQEEKDKKDLEQYILKLLEEEKISIKVRKQIETFKKDYNYSYTGMKKALVYFYEVKKNPIEKANGGIGIIPYVYKDAFNYYYAIWEANQRNEQKEIKNYLQDEIVIKISPPQRNIKKRKMFSFLEEEE